MSIMMDHAIRKRCMQTDTPMIEPFINKPIREIDGKRILSYGLSSGGYDVRVGNEFRIFSNINSTIIDPLNFDEECLHTHIGDRCIIPPHSYALAVTEEYFRIPRDVMVVCVGKSTLCRSGIIINVSPIEPGFEGTVVIEAANTTPLPAIIYAKQGIAQFLFFESESECEMSYKDKNGKYQGQIGMVLPRV